MAFAHSFYRVNIDFTETSGKSVRRTYKLNPATVTTDAGASSGFLDIVAALVPLTDAVINMGQWENVYVDTNALPSAAENSNQALITGKLTGKPNQSGDLSIPAAKAAIFTAPTGKGYDIVDIANTDVQTFLDLFEAGGFGVISDGDTLVAGTESGRRRNVHSLGS